MNALNALYVTQTGKSCFSVAGRLERARGIDLDVPGKPSTAAMRGVQSGERVRASEGVDQGRRQGHAARFPARRTSR